MVQNDRPRLASMIKSDYLAGLAVKIPAIFWIIIAVGVVMNLAGAGGGGLVSFDQESARSLPFLAVGSTALAVPLLYWRYRYFSGLFASGICYTGTVTAVAFRRRRGYVEYAFKHEGEEYRGFNSVFKNALTEILKVNDKVTVLMDEKNKKKTFIKELFA